MPRKVRQAQRKQYKERLLKLALVGPDAAGEARTLLARIPDCVCDTQDDYKLWILAARGGHAGVLQVFLDGMVNIGLDRSEITVLLDQGDLDGETALIAAARNGRAGAVRRLLEAGASPTKEAMSEAISGLSPCAHLVVNLLLGAGVRPTEAIHKAATEKGNAETVLSLLQHGGCRLSTMKIILQGKRWDLLSAMVRDDPSVLELAPEACSLGQLKRQRVFADCIKWQIERPNLDAGLDIVRCILQNGLIPVGVFLLDWIVCARRSTPLLEEILDHCKRTGLDKTPKFRTKAGHTLNNIIFRDDTLESVRALLEAGADVEWKSHCGETALSRAVKGTGGRKIQSVSLLIKYGASPNSSSNKGGTVLISAVRTWCADDEVVTFLLDSGADVDALGHGGATALHYAVSSLPLPRLGMVKVLLDAGADGLLKNAQGKTALDLLNDREKNTCASDIQQRETIAECRPYLERHTLLPLVFWDKTQSNNFCRLAETGRETSAALQNRIGSYLCNM